MSRAFSSFKGASIPVNTSGVRLVLEAGHVLRMDRFDRLDETGSLVRFTRVVAQVRADPARPVHEQGEKAVVARRLRLGSELEELLAARLRGQVPIGHHGEKEAGALDLFLQLRAPVVAPLEHNPVNNEIDGSAPVVAGLLHCSGELGQCAAVLLVVGVHMAQEDRWIGRGGRGR